MTAEWGHDAHDNIKVLSNNLLKIENIQDKNEGIYECKINNEFGQDVLPYIVEVLSKPEIADLEVNLDGSYVANTDFVEVKENSSLQLAIDFKAKPDAFILWLKNDGPIEENDKV